MRAAALWGTEESGLGQGRRSRGAVKGSALPQKADQPLLQSMISSVPDSDVAGPKILAYSRVRSVAAVRSLRRAVWSTLGLAGEQAWICQAASARSDLRLHRRRRGRGDNTPAQHG